jgi:LETM1 and EF-hand domain-containing protein 1
MTKEQLSELAEALNILTAKSSIVKERRELQTLLEDNMLSEAVSCHYLDQATLLT